MSVSLGVFEVIDMGLFDLFKRKANAVNSESNEMNRSDGGLKTRFSLDFIRTPAGEGKKVEVEFPQDNIWKILINGEAQRYYPGMYEEVGWSSDRKYRKVRADGFMFWISPSDYSAFVKLLKDLKIRYAQDKEDRKQSYQSMLEQYRAGVQVDAIDNDVSWCYFESPNGFQGIDDERKFHSLETKIAQICEKNGGHLYKTRAKSAKFAILVSPSSRKQDNVERIRSMGYKVTTLEEAVKFWQLEKYWNIAEAEARYQEFIRNLANSPYLK